LAVFLFIMGLGCTSNNNSFRILKEARKKLNSNSTIQYNFRSIVDTRVNDTHYSMQGEVIYSKLTDSNIGFGGYVEMQDFRYICDGMSFISVDDKDSIVIMYDPEEIKRDTGFWEGTVLSPNPFYAVKEIKNQNAQDTSINGISCSLYNSLNVKKSVIDTNQTVYYHRSIALDKELAIIKTIRDVTIRDGDTLQIMTHYYENIELKVDIFNFNIYANQIPSNFKYITQDDYISDIHSHTINEGVQLQKTKYQDLNGKEINLASGRNKTLLMFSFIGCGACEIALKEIESLNYKFKENINFVYASSRDDSKRLKKYLNKKDFSKPAIAQESYINDEFNIFFYPTFVLINESGKVEEISDGYDKDYILNLMK